MRDLFRRSFVEHVAAEGLLVEWREFAFNESKCLADEISRILGFIEFCVGILGHLLAVHFNRQRPTLALPGAMPGDKERFEPGVKALGGIVLKLRQFAPENEENILNQVGAVGTL